MLVRPAAGPFGSLFCTAYPVLGFIGMDPEEIKPVGNGKDHGPYKKSDNPVEEQSPDTPDKDDDQRGLQAHSH